MTKQEAIQKTKEENRKWLDLQIKHAAKYGEESIRAAKSEKEYYISKGLI